MRIKQILVSAGVIVGTLMAGSTFASAASNSVSASKSSTVDTTPAATVTNPYAYFKAQKTVKVPLSGTDQTVKIKKNTIVPGYVFQDAFRTQLSIRLNLSSLSYQTRKSWGKISNNTNWQQSGATEQASSFVAVAAPQQMLFTKVNDLPLTGMFYVGTKANANGTTKLKSRLVITTDGYIERYYDAYPRMSFKPMATAKINKVVSKGSVEYLYYAKHIKGVKDKHVAKSGKTQYQLTIKNLNKSTSTKVTIDNDTFNQTYSVFTFGTQKYFTLANQVIL
ncbi:hypothetical protein [Lentilactobacillus sp. SPB1-3]|uniref:Uncharacterized protein n=1 Tax=Lentilactobacillus terminaliae TaxID=3003483 RepID=A0ACD5DD96_9LACO|nr:hypothetical protein [Lentilactobacillus sp. SPB1-3]MCZ0977959.1 hypothetical protein [Lentilactobacillus sp. SPB1-3]